MRQRKDFLDVLRNRHFRTFWLAQAVSGLGSWLAMFALVSLGGFRFKLAAGELGGMAALFFLALALIFPFAGTIVDRTHAQKVMIISDGFRASLMFLLWFVWEPDLLYPIFLLTGCATCFFLSAQLTLLPAVVDREELLTANALGAQTQQMNGILAPILAGFVIARFGERFCFALNGASFIFSALCLSRLAPHLEASAAHRSRPFWHDLRDAVNKFAHDRVLLSVMSLAMVMIVIASAINIFGVLYVRDVLRAGPRDFGLLLSSLGAGAAVGFWFVGRYAHAIPRMLLIRASAVAIGAGLIGMTLLTRVIDVLVGAFLMGVAAAAFLVPAQTLVQERTPWRLLGRTGGLAWSLLFATQAIAAIGLGRLAAVLTLPALYRGLGVGVLVFTGLLTLYELYRARGEDRACA
ncbi:MAG: MFS transporter [Blastocatellia bacterium]|nr:MFS transporter [Blastocatellia bacterium]MCS7156818.1 MFS transporter [Blastocatellia bacterium]MDW8167509.1 MFS transporter [Acidobacteriota bacterium]MDW8256856.1 MFS transporter [Acidobacteriota bacterium]